MNELIGWVAVKDGQLKGGLSVETTKRSLLIGFDLMPLLGLEECESRLVSKGVVITQAQVAICDEDNRTCYSATYQGKLDSEMLEYTVNAHDPLQVMRAAAGFLFNRDIPMTRNETFALYRFWLHYRDIAADGRRKTTAKRLYDDVERIFNSFGVAVVPISITPEYEAQPA